MIKYVSDILNNFTQGQRIWALIIVLISIVTITLGPLFIKGILLDRDEYVSRIQTLEKRERTLIAEKDSIISLLGDQKLDCLAESDSLVKKIANQRKEFTDQIYARETEFLEKIRGIYKTLSSSYQDYSKMKSSSYYSMTTSPAEIYNPDTLSLLDGEIIVSTSLSYPAPVPEDYVESMLEKTMEQLETLSNEMQNRED